MLTGILQFLIAFTFSAVAVCAEDDYHRYPYRIPEWLWQKSELSFLLSDEKLKNFESDLKVLKTLSILENDVSYHKKNKEVAVRLGQTFSLKDLTEGVVSYSNPRDNINLALIVDPRFSKETISTINKAVELLVQVALNDDVIQNALDTSVDSPSPMPDMYQMKDGKPVLDVYGNKIYSKEYSFYRLYQVQWIRPRNLSSFKSHIREAYTPIQEDPALLVISYYPEHGWWGAAHFNFFHQPEQQLSRVEPERGFLYIRLNSNKFKEGSDHYNNPAFWASKIGHLVLHNLGYWHPSYKSPDDCLKHNQGDTKSFIIAYEDEIYKKASELMNNK